MKNGRAGGGGAEALGRRHLLDRMKHQRAPPANAVASEAGGKAMREKREDGIGAAARFVSNFP
jgi:hypothetical protein